MKYLNNIDLSKNELQNVRLHNLSADPGSPVAGQLYFNSSSNVVNVWNGSAWINFLDRAAHTGTQTVSTLSDFTSGVQTIVNATSLTSLAAPSTSLSLNSQRITNLADGVSATDAASYGQLLSVQNGTDWKNSVRVATTANITLSGLQTIDDITVVANDRVLVKNQTTASQNGLYAASSGAWTRTSDADSNAEVTSQLAVMVEEGTTQSATQWRITTTGPITLGTTSISFAQIGAGTSYVQGTGITISGNTISIDTAVTARRYSSLVGDGTTTSIAVTHNLGNQYVTAQVFDATSNALVLCDVVLTSSTVATFSFAVAPTTNQYRVVIVG